MHARTLQTLCHRNLLDTLALQTVTQSPRMHPTVIVVEARMLMI